MIYASNDVKTPSSCVSISAVLFFSNRRNIKPELREVDLRRILKRAGYLTVPEAKKHKKKGLGALHRLEAELWRDTESQKQYRLIPVTEPNPTAGLETEPPGFWCVLKNGNSYRAAISLGAQGCFFVDPASDESKVGAGQARRLSAAWGQPFHVQQVSAGTDPCAGKKPKLQKKVLAQTGRLRNTRISCATRKPASALGDVRQREIETSAVFPFLLASSLDGLRVQMEDRLEVVCDMANATLLADKLTNPASQVTDSQAKIGDIGALEELLAQSSVLDENLYPVRTLARLWPDNPYVFIVDLFEKFSLGENSKGSIGGDSWPDYVCNYIVLQKPQLGIFALRIRDKQRLSASHQSYSDKRMQVDAKVADEPIDCDDKAGQGHKGSSLSPEWTIFGEPRPLPECHDPGWTPLSDTREVFGTQRANLEGCGRALADRWLEQESIYLRFLEAKRLLSPIRQFSWSAPLFEDEDCFTFFSRIYQEAHVQIFDAWLVYLIHEKDALKRSARRPSALVFWPGESGPVPLENLRPPERGSRYASLNHMRLCMLYFGGDSGGNLGGVGVKTLQNWVSSGRPLFKNYSALQRVFVLSNVSESLDGQPGEWLEYRLAFAYRCQLCWNEALAKGLARLPSLCQDVVTFLDLLINGDQAGCTQKLTKCIRPGAEEMRRQAAAMESFGGWLVSPSWGNGDDSNPFECADSDAYVESCSAARAFRSLHLYIYETVASVSRPSSVLSASWWLRACQKNENLKTALYVVFDLEDGAQRLDRFLASGAAECQLAETERKLNELEERPTDHGLISQEQLKRLAQEAAGCPPSADGERRKNLATRIARLEKTQQKAIKERGKEREMEDEKRMLKAFFSTGLCRLLSDIVADQWLDKELLIEGGKSLGYGGKV